MSSEADTLQLYSAVAHLLFYVAAVLLHAARRAYGTKLKLWSNSHNADWSATARSDTYDLEADAEIADEANANPLCFLEGCFAYLLRKAKHYATSPVRAFHELKGSAVRPVNHLCYVVCGDGLGIGDPSELIKVFANNSTPIQPSPHALSPPPSYMLCRRRAHLRDAVGVGKATVAAGVERRVRVRHLHVSVHRRCHWLPGVICSLQYCSLR